MMQLHSPQNFSAFDTCNTGFCALCNKEHSLTWGHSYRQSLILMQQLETANRIDFNVGRENSDSRLSTKYLFSKARGKMFGVLTCYSDTKTIFLKAFSGQYNGIWNVEGWVPPLFDISEFEELNNVEEKRIKILSNKINQLENSSLQKKHLVNKRKKMSQALMKKIHNIYKIPNFHGIEKSLFEIFPDNTGIPTGTGDCCAPKLLAFAARNNLIPLGMTEFYWGLENKAQTRLHGFFTLLALNDANPSSDTCFAVWILSQQVNHLTFRASLMC